MTNGNHVLLAYCEEKRTPVYVVRKWPTFPAFDDVMAAVVEFKRVWSFKDEDELTWVLGVEMTEE